MTPQKRSNEEKEVPLFLLPQVIARQIRKTGDKIYRISLKRTHLHHYNVSVRTKAIRKELVPIEQATITTVSTSGIGKRSHKSKPGCTA